MVTPESRITATSTPAEVAATFPATRAVLARHGIDLCCGGARPLGEVARLHGLDAAALLEELQHAAEG